MRNMGIVRGSIESAIPFEICVDTVYLRFNIQPVSPQASEDDDDMGMTGEQYQYHEIQYDLREWLQVLTEAMIDTNSFALAGELVKELDARAEDMLKVAEPMLGIPMPMNQVYIGLPEQKPFTFNTRFTPRRS